MNIEEIIESGTLELYITGSLSQREAMEVEELLASHPAVLKEVEAIEASLLGLAKEDIEIPPHVWESIRDSIKGVRRLPVEKRSTPWSSITGWAAAILCFLGVFWMMQKNATLQDELQVTTTQKVVLEDQIEQTESALASSNELLDILRSKDYRSISLPGNDAVSTTAYAKVYYNDAEKVAYVDARGLPTPPRGKVYQVWSLIMQPLTPRSVGLLDGFETSESKVFRLENIPDPEAFGITLEPEGGSESPNLEQLYALGTVAP